MHRNTAIIIITLALIVTLIIGVNIGRTLSPTSASPTSSPYLTSPLASPLETQVYTHEECGITFIHDPSYTLNETSDSAQLTHQTSDEKITIVCGVDFPKPPLPDDLIEEATVAGQPATIYHDASAKDGTPVDVVVLTHPEKNHEIGLFGFGEQFKQLLNSLKIL